MILPDWLACQSATRPEQPALVDAEGMLTFAELEARARTLAARLRSAGIGPGDRVGTLLPAGRLLTVLVHAVPRTGATLALLDPGLPAPAVEQAAARARLRLLVVDGGTRVSAAEVTTILPDDLPFADGLDVPSPGLEADAAHTIVFTSGTSGDPKAVVLTAANHLWSAMTSAARLGALPDDRWLACLPPWHVGGLAVLLRSAILGTTVLLHRRFDTETIARALHDQAATMVSLVPTMLRRLLDADRRPPASLRCALIGGASASPALLRSARERGWAIAPTYGCTEAASQIATAAPGDPHAVDGSVGLPLLATRVQVVQPDGRAAPAGEPGLITVAGPTLSPGCLDAAGDLVVRESEWLRTGDLGRLDADGRLHVFGRDDDIIVSGGEKVAPATVEAVLAELPGVLEVAVASLPDVEWGAAVTAWVVPRPGEPPTLEGLRAAARLHLAAHALPRRLVLVDALPRTPSGKLRRAALRA